MIHLNILKILLPSIINGCVYYIINKFFLKKVKRFEKYFIIHLKVSVKLFTVVLINNKEFLYWKLKLILLETLNAREKYNFS